MLCRRVNLLACRICDNKEMVRMNAGCDLCCIFMMNWPENCLGMPSCEIRVWSVGCRNPCFGLPAFVILLGKNFMYWLRGMLLAQALRSIFTLNTMMPFL